MLLFFFQFSFFLWTTLGLFLLFPFAFIPLSLITHICFSSLRNDLRQLVRLTIAVSGAQFTVRPSRRDFTLIYLRPQSLWPKIPIFEFQPIRQCSSYIIKIDVVSVQKGKALSGLNIGMDLPTEKVEEQKRELARQYESIRKQCELIEQKTAKLFRERRTNKVKGGL
jgi:hypothetical protein